MTESRNDGITDRLKTVYPPKTSFCGGYNNLKNDVLNKDLEINDKQTKVAKMYENGTDQVESAVKHYSFEEKPFTQNEPKGQALKHQSTTKYHFGGRYYNKLTSEKKASHIKRDDIAMDEAIHDKKSLLAIKKKAQMPRAFATGKVAFSAYLGHDVSGMGIGHTIKCDQILLNDGNAYNPFTGAFTAPASGVYLLTFHIDVWNQSISTLVKLVKNNENVVDAVATPRGTYGHDVMGGNTAIIHLNQGDAVWLESYISAAGQVHSNTNFRVTTFSGILLYT